MLKKLTAVAAILVMTTAYAQSSQHPPSEHGPSSQSENQPRPRGERPTKPDLSQAAEKLGISEDVLHQAMKDSGGPPPNLEKAAASLGISVDALKAVLPAPPSKGKRK